MLQNMIIVAKRKILYCYMTKNENMQKDKNIQRNKKYKGTKICKETKIYDNYMK